MNITSIISNKNKTIFFIVRCCLLMCMFTLHISAKAQTENLTVITNTKGAPEELKFSDLRSILMGEKQRWRNGNKIMIALMKTNTAAGNSICKKIYDMSSDELKKFWLALVFDGKSDGPVFLNSAAEVQSYVAENPGAIGVTDQQQEINDTHIVLIDGKKAF